jgi:hypothetical protein
MTEVRETVDKVVNAMIRDHGAEYAAGYLNSFLVRIIEKGVKDDIERSMILIELLADGIGSKIDAIKA